MLKIDREFRDYKAQGEADAEQIVYNHMEELAEALHSWHKHGHDGRFNPADFVCCGGCDAWVNEGHSLSGCAIDMWEAVAILEQVPKEHHETDRGQWLEDCCTKTVESCGTATYENYVEQLFAGLIEQMGENTKEKARTAKGKLTRGQVNTIIDELLSDE